MIRRAVAVRYDDNVDNGRTEPLRVTIETDDSNEFDVILKLSAGRECSILGLASEMMGSLLAFDLGLPVMEPFFVELDDIFVQAIASPPLRRRLQEASHLGFASLYASKQWRRWQAIDKVATDQREMASGIFAFDAFTGNGDRRPGNPNMLVRGAEWRLIDHEAAFHFRLMHFPKCEPWCVGNLAAMQYGGAAEHLFARFLHRGSVQINHLAEKWRGLSDARLEQYEAALPDEWRDARDHVAVAVSHLKRVRDNLDLCLTELKRALA